MGFGSFRLFLALLVAASHVGQGTPGIGHLGIFAVIAFYVLSGYLMTRVLHEVYAFDFTPFFANRALRLFPLYYAVCALTLPLVLLFPAEAGKYHVAYAVLTRPLDLLGNLLIVPFEFYDRQFRLVPPTWSIAVEIINYFALWLVVARSARLALAALVLGAAYHVGVLALGRPWTEVYYPALAAVLPFAGGALIYFVARNPRWRHRSSLAVPVLTATFVANLVMPTVSGWLLPWYYVDLLLSVALVHALVSRPTSRADKLMGDLAYPVFLVHWVAGFAVSLATGVPVGTTLMLLTIVPTMLVAWGLCLVSERLIEPVRDKVRSRELQASSAVTQKS